MTADDPIALIGSLPGRDKEPTNARVLDSWVTAAHDRVELDSGRLGWLVASTVVVAALQRAVGSSSEPRFLLKGGTYLQHRLGRSARPTKDVDGIINGDIEQFVHDLDTILAEPWGPLTLERGPVETIETPARVTRPRRLDVRLGLRGKVWRRIQVEIAPEEGSAARDSDVLTAPSLEHFGLPSPDRLLGIALRYQIAQKLHACTDPHQPPAHRNDRARDVVDLLSLRGLAELENAATAHDLRAACVDVFGARADDARRLGRMPREWPCTVVPYPHWGPDFAAAAEAAGRPHLTLDEAVRELNTWIMFIDGAG
ncbi:nucleotidyl transferase AbiEii/AbiGii toxin family protein [Promicromonospora sukumoe]|uniref:nucleotidyl transferase AbiEii/AbiGii toxin family protein n=1 Tax=Promicromonospora sukumoe TaxID=88382 RepID=UPI000363222A|nr:nucleotidyl transferase AbiEii/AbiGii toxin family protein [Promicromonospora sukumoe]